MTTGIGIVISTTILAVVALLIAKKDKWTWKGLFLYPALIIAVVSGIIALAVSGYTNGYYGPNKIGREMEYAGIRLRSTKSDVRFVMGKVTKEEAPEDDQDEEAWAYGTSNSDTTRGDSVIIWFGKDGLVSGVAVYKETYRSLPSLKWIHEYTSLKSIKDRLGEAQFVEDIDDGQQRIYRYTTHNLRFFYSKDGLGGIGIRDYERYPYKPEVAIAQISPKTKPVAGAPKWEDLSPVKPTPNWTPEQQQALAEAEAILANKKAITDKGGLDPNKPYTVAPPAHNWRDDPIVVKEHVKK